MPRKSITTSNISRSISIFTMVLLHYIVIAIIIQPHDLKNSTSSSISLTIVAPPFRPKNKNSNPSEQTNTAKNQRLNWKKSPLEIQREKFLYAENTEPSKSENEHPKTAEDLSFDSLSQSLKQKNSRIDFASPNHLNSHLNLKIDVTKLKTELSPVQRASNDVRSNSARLTTSESFAVATGSLDCIFQSRLADGQIIREPGRWIVVPARSEGGLKTLAVARFCVRLNQSSDQFISDMSAIREGLKGKK